MLSHESPNAQKVWQEPPLVSEGANGGVIGRLCGTKLHVGKGAHGRIGSTHILIAFIATEQRLVDGINNILSVNVIKSFLGELQWREVFVSPFMKGRRISGGETRAVGTGTDLSPTNGAGRPFWR